MEQDVSNQHSVLHQQLRGINRGGNDAEDFEFGGAQTTGFGAIMYAALTLMLTTTLLFAVFGNFQVAALSGLVVLVLIVMFMVNFYRQRHKLRELREEQLKHYRKSKGDTRYWGREGSK
ncbi:MAG: hypothetical protein AAF478_02255 [Pseudomonadota bacterium]